MLTHPADNECEVLRQLRDSPRLFELIGENTEGELQLQQRLRLDYPEEVVRAALTIRDLRLRAARKFSRADRMWFDRQGLEQATSEVVARHKAKRFQQPVSDYCCGIGGDSIALAGHCDVTAVDRSPASLLCTAWNAAAYGVESRLQLLCAEVETLPPMTKLVHIDPDRRPHGRGRMVRVEDGVPGLDYLRKLAAEFQGGAIKLSPAGNFAGKFDAVEYELISLDGECKEATVWFGSLADAGIWRATALPSGESLAGDPMDAAPEVGPLGSYLYDPDPAIVRSGLLNVLCEKIGLTRLDDAEEYLTSDVPVASPFVRGFEVLAELPNNQRAIRDYFRKADFGPIEIKCRRIPIEAETVRRKLPLEGDKPGVLVFARILGKARAIVCSRID